MDATGRLMDVAVTLDIQRGYQRRKVLLLRRTCAKSPAVSGRVAGRVWIWY